MGKSSFEAGLVMWLAMNYFELSVLVRETKNPSAAPAFSLF